MTAHLVQLLLPLRNNAGEPFPAAMFDAVRQELTQRFGGLTAYTRAPAEGLFSDAAGRVVHDDVVVLEVMCDALDPDDWRARAVELAARFEQDEVLIRALPVLRL